VLADQIARRRDQTDVALFFEDRVDGNSQHHFGLARAGRRFEEKLEDVGVESGADRVDRRLLIGGQRERLTGLDEFVGLGNRLGVAVDRRPDVVF